MELGIQWLYSLGTLSLDFKNLRIEFMLKGKHHLLLRAISRLIRVLNATRMQNTLKQSSHGALAQLFSIQSYSTNSYQPNTNQVILLNDIEQPQLVVVLEQSNLFLLSQRNFGPLEPRIIP